MGGTVKNFALLVSLPVLLGLALALWQISQEVTREQQMMVSVVMLLAFAAGMLAVLWRVGA